MRGPQILVRRTALVLLALSAAALSGCTPVTPRGLTATPQGATAIQVEWTQNTDQPSLVYDLVRDGGGQTVTTTGLSATTATITGLEPATTYTFRVRARNSLGEASTYSAAASATTSAGGGAGTETFHTSANQAFVNAAGQSVVLKGVNTRDVVPTGYTQARYAALRPAFNSVRMPLDWDDFEPQQGQFSQTALAKLDEEIAEAKAAGLYVILDPIHLKSAKHLGGIPAWAKAPGEDGVATVRRAAPGWIRTVAARYATEPAVVAVDLVNEVQTDPAVVDNARLIDLYNTLITAYRTADPDKILILESLSGDWSIASTDLSKLAQRSNVVWSMHMYAAGDPAGDADLYSAGGFVTGTEVWDCRTGYARSQTARDQMRAHILVTRAKANAAGLPLYVGEYGIGRYAPGAQSYLEDLTTIFDDLGLSRAAWEWHATGTADDPNTCTVTAPDWSPLYPTVFQ